ncbi:twin-arginine translocase subunit TatC [Bailinhaonella thermotolerans]|uniref:Sec-independent protein translocase protein TatC n=2 Tax=Bailinhaonella thermotolerans TaxID=1070861 RepID=A0A3A4BXF7_9ACTN|nr:twin-arginine translocase subunit TatC [Bailinhaonella thermotolerans]
MPLIEHLRELRGRLVKSVLGLVLGAVIGFVFFDTLWDFLVQPYCQLPQTVTKNGTCELYFHNPFDAFLINIKIAAIFGLVIAAPIWIYQIWAFVTPGLYQNERRYTVAFMLIAVPLFVAGAALAYAILDKGLAIMLGFAPDMVKPLIGMDEYLGFTLGMLLIFGVSFELPLFLVFLNLIGVLPHEKVKKNRALIIFLMFVFGAVATPTTDPFGMLVLAIPMVGLFFAAELFMFLRDRRKPKGEDYSGLDDDEASPIDLGTP